MDAPDPTDDDNGDDRPESVRLSELQTSLRTGDGRGIRCPDCHGTWFQVIRTTQKADKIVRRRACRRCGREILTTERLTG